MARQFWVWVTTPEFYAEEDGADRADLDPEFEQSNDGWWTCHERTQPGDLVLLYRTAPRSDLAYLFEARSEGRALPKPPLVSATRLDELLADRAEQSPEVAEALERVDRRSTMMTGYSLQVESGVRDPEDLANLPGALPGEIIEDPEAEYELLDAERLRLAGLSPDTVIYLDDPALLAAAGYGDVDPAFEAATRFVARDVCEWESLRVFAQPLSLAEMQTDPYLQEWGALRASFQGSVFTIPETIWARLIALLDAGNPGLSDFLAKHTAGRKAAPSRVEQDLEERLEANPSVIAPGLQVYIDAAGRSGRQYWAGGIGRLGARIDLLCTDQDGDFVVVELKAERARNPVVAQTAMYMGWVEQHLAGPGQSVRGIVIAPGHDAGFPYALGSHGRIQYMDAVELAAKVGLQW